MNEVDYMRITAAEALGVELVGETTKKLKSDGFRIREAEKGAAQRRTRWV